MRVQCSEFRRDDPTLTERLNAERSKRLLIVIPNRKAVLQFAVRLREVSYKSDRERNFWGSVSKSPVVGFRIWQYHRENVGWVECNETQQNLE